MDRKYIDREHIVDRYLSGDLTVREAREFEKYCLEDPEYLNGLPIPVRLKARLSRQPLEGSETGMFQAIPSSATRVALDANEEGFDPAEEPEELRRAHGGIGSSRAVLFVLGFALIAAIGGLVAYGVQASKLEEEIRKIQRETQSSQMQAPGSAQIYRVELSRSKPTQPTLSLSWPVPPVLWIYASASMKPSTTLSSSPSTKSMVVV